MKSPLNDPARAPSGQFVDRSRRSGGERTVAAGRAMPGPAAGQYAYRAKASVGANTMRIGASTAYGGAIKGKKKRIIGGGKAIRLRKWTWLFHWRAANDASQAPAPEAPAPAHLTPAERAFLAQALARLNALPPGFTDDLMNAPPFPAGYPEILGGD